MWLFGEAGGVHCCSLEKVSVDVRLANCAFEGFFEGFGVAATAAKPSAEEGRAEQYLEHSWKYFDDKVVQRWH
jgi:hypothetical protein